MTETECSTLFKNHDHKECCDAPGPRLNDLFRVCRRRCRSPGTCCAYDCYQDCLQIFVDGKLNVDKMLETFEDDLVAMPEIEWKPIIKKSIETCLKLSKCMDSFDEPFHIFKINIISVPETTEVEKCNGSSSMYLDLIYRCVKKLNFLACPNFNNTEKCKATKEFIENNDKCGEKVGETFVISISYWVDLRSRKTSDVKTYLESEIAAKRYRANERCMLELVHHNPQACCKIEAANMQEVVSSCQEKRRNGANMTVEQCFQEAAFFDGKPQVATILKTFEPESKDVNSKAVIEKSIDTCSKPCKFFCTASIKHEPLRNNCFLLSFPGCFRQQ